MGEKRIGVNPIPTKPRDYINEQQIYGLTVLRKFGWRLVCVRRRSKTPPTILLKNCLNKTYGILSGEGTLKLSNDLKIRDPYKFKCDNV